jgi:tetrapyrrole methylase family protein/MazG family protein
MFDIFTPATAAFGLEAAHQISLLLAGEVAGKHVPTFPVHAPALIFEVDSTEIASQLKRVLRGLYPGLHPVRLAHAIGTDRQTVEDLTLEALDRGGQYDLRTVLYVPRLGKAVSFEELHEVMAHLRAPEGCPWDREQTHASMRSGMLEEAYEVLDAIDAGDIDALREELGDLLLNVLMQAQIAAENGEFTIADSLHGINTKLVRRHPHVFGDLEVNGTEAVLQNWEKLKAEERKTKGQAEKSLLDGISKSLPALAQAAEYANRAARVGFEWPDIRDALAKVDEELAEVHAAEAPADRQDEIGDLLFAVANLARWYDVDPESALRQAGLRFRQRFGYIEAAARNSGRPVNELQIDEMLALWAQAKLI